ncbi:RNA polymerase sigma-70 factor [Massilibacteroides vaginae]|uniref:RNA polymerase sigma-70 factor n=1 Tax=Massilibacteroides vaginae TaxID=1673718 RepID=UPI000A1CAFDD|nr:RNA polymerase sigma-70 factor [Massilibacteroides vaginae]
MPQVEQFNGIYVRYYQKAYRFSWMYVRNDQVAEDIAAESLIKLWETMKKEPVEKPLALLLTILKYKSLDYLKKQIRTDEAFEAMAKWQQRELSIRISTLEGCNPDDIFSKEIQTIITRTLNEFPAQTRKVFMLSRFEQKSGKEIAESLGITVKGVDYHIAKVLKALRISLKDYLPLFYFLFLH